ncbi:MAG: riboflavin biosynthesis protein RibF [Candidatus Omnitrophica bacterium]|nr:riboflavin biosynthesis protein RibF [Candidatus Omnitrophota bacterium]
MPSARVLKGLNAVASPPTRAVVTVGVFDGVHIAHQRLIRSTVKLARRLDGTSVAITFDPDPQIVLDPAHAQPALMPLGVRVSTLHALGLDWVWILPFTARFARVTAEQFIRRILVHRLRARALVIGEAFVFGNNRQGDMDVLRRLGPSYGIRVVPVRQVRRLGMPVSSSRIRRLIGLGGLAQARGLLGRPPALYGVVVPGRGRGRRMGFPTANIRLIPQVLPPRGVYAVAVRSEDGRHVWRGVMNLGVRPTFGPGPMVCEVHLLRFVGTLLGRPISVSVLARLRAERCFPSWQALGQQVRRDIARARQLFAQFPRFLRS